MRRAVFACLLSSCTFQHGELATADSRGPDVPAGCASYSSLFDTCTVGASLAPPPMVLAGGAWTYNTDTHTLTAPNGQPTSPAHVILDAAEGPLDVVFVAALTLEADATLRVTGPNFDRPLGIAAAGDVDIRGILDVSNNGAGSRSDAACGAQVGNRGQNSTQGAGGSGGGALHGAGGDGSAGNKDGTNTAFGTGGSARTTRPRSPIGGCDGGDGGDGSGMGGQGGDGGGAIYIASATAIRVATSGVIDAGGGGGQPGGQNADAGGGGGSGGMILLESAMIAIQGIVVANGGGGGEGNNGMPGQPGQRGAARAAGGAGGDGTGGDGAAGGAGTGLDGLATSDLQNGGGGGGGGGVGYIAIACPAPMLAGAVISPPLESWP